MFRSRNFFDNSPGAALYFIEFAKFPAAGRNRVRRISYEASFSASVTTSWLIVRGIVYKNAFPQKKGLRVRVKNVTSQKE